MDLQLPDGNVLSHDPGSPGLEVATAIGPGLARAAVAVAVDGVLMDLSQPITTGGAFRVITLDSARVSTSCGTPRHM